METTMDLLDRALAQGMTKAQWCRNLDINRTALNVAQIRGRLSPTVAGNLARLLGEDEEKWIAIAALEAEPDSYAKSKLLTRLTRWPSYQIQTSQRINDVISP